ELDRERLADLPKAVGRRRAVENPVRSMGRVGHGGEVAQAKAVRPVDGRESLLLAQLLGRSQHVLLLESDKRQVARDKTDDQKHGKIGTNVDQVPRHDLIARASNRFKTVSQLVPAQGAL